MEISDLNPWWKTGHIREDVDQLPRRELFSEICRYLEDRQILVLTGLRRTGKTVMMLQVIQQLLTTHPKERICYYNFDLGEETIESLLENYRRLTGVDYRQEKIFLFLDEIQKHPSWENEIKVLYDFRQIKFVLSGSSSLFIEKKSKESLAGRTFSFHLAPLSFREYLRLREKESLAENPALYKNEIQSAFRHYLRTGGFPELLLTEEEFKIDKYIKEFIVDRVIYIDIPKVFEIGEPELLVKLLSLVSAHPGMITDYENLADDLQRDRKTISNYFFYLEKSFLIKRLYNYSRNLLTSEKKSKRLYPASTAFAYLYSAEPGRITESAVLMNAELTFFSRRGGKEVDFIQVKGQEILPIEVKSAFLRFKAKEIKGLLLFLRQEQLRKGLILTEEGEGKEIIKGMEVTFLPLWKWLLR